MTLDELTKMDAGKRDAMVAEKVMGWKVHPRNTGHWVAMNDDRVGYRVMGMTCGVDVFAPSSDPAADYAVLVKVRATLEKPLRNKFRIELDGVFDTRDGVLPDPIQYRPGDYSLAALMVVLGEGQGEA